MSLAKTKPSSQLFTHAPFPSYPEPEQNFARRSDMHSPEETQLPTYGSCPLGIYRSTLSPSDRVTDFRPSLEPIRPPSTSSTASSSLSFNGLYPLQHSISKEHCSRSSVSSSTSHLFSPKLSQETGLSPSTPPLHAQGRTHQQPASRSKKPSMANSPTAPLAPEYVSQLAIYLAEMVVYLWYSPPQHKRAPTFPKPSSEFYRFCHEVLMTTQVSRSVVVLALLYIWRLQGKHGLDSRPGSEYRITVTGLMLANKILDDHTYTNRTWSDVSGLPLTALNESEIKVLQGLEFELHVTQTTFDAWLELLERPKREKLWPRGVSQRKKSRISYAVDNEARLVAPSAPTSPNHRIPAAFPDPAERYSTYGASSRPSTSYARNQPMFPSYPAQAQHYLDYEAQRPLSAHYPAPDSRKRKVSFDGSASSPTHPVYSRDFAAFPPQMPYGYLPPPSAAEAHFSSTASESQQNGSDVDFSTLASSITPPAAQRNPGNLAYYALAAGQQRGGFLAYQPAGQYMPPPPYQPAPVAARSIAPMPRHAQHAAQQQPAAWSQPMQGAPFGSRPLLRTSLSLSPTEAKTAQYEQPSSSARPYARSPRHPLQSSAMSASTYSSPLLSYGIRPEGAPRASLPSIGSLTRGLPSFNIPQQAHYPPPQQQQQSQHYALPPPVAFNPNNSNPPPGYYSSFSNSGLPGVAYWQSHTGYAGAEGSNGYAPRSAGPATSLPWPCNSDTETHEKTVNE